MSVQSYLSLKLFGVLWIVVIGSDLFIPCVPENNQTLCLCSFDGKYTDCAGKNLSYIPKIPKTTTSLIMSGNSLTQLNSIMFLNISDTSVIKHLDISNNSISTVEKTSFSIFTDLASLNISSNPINMTAIENTTNGISRSLDTLFLESLSLEECPYQAIQSLHDTRLQYLSLKNNSIKSFNGSKIFRFLKDFHHLDLSYNSIFDLLLSYFKTLEYLSLSSNNLVELPRCCSGEQTFFPNLKYLFMDDNCISKLQMSHINCLDNLRLLNISATRIKEIKSNTFSRLKSLQTITLESTDSLMYLRPYAFNSPSLKKIYIRFNNIPFRKPFVDVETIFEKCSQLTHVDFSGNQFGKMRHEDWRNLLKHIPNLIYLDFSMTDTLNLPIAISTYLHQLQSLHAVGNSISVIPNNFFKPLKNLKMLLLNSNKLTRITLKDFPPTLTGHLDYLNLAYNPLVCDCELLWFIKFAKSNKNIIKSFPNHYECANKRGMVVTHANIHDKLCLIRQETGEIIKCTCMAVITLLLLMSGVYRYRWRIRYVIFMLKYHRRKYTNYNGLALRYDMYVSCSERDFPTVYNIVCKLEADDNLIIFIPQRDATPGKLMVNQTLENIDSSKCVLLCLSDSYAQDNWCEFEACMAIERSVGEDPDYNSLIVVVLEEMDSVNVTTVIHKLTRNDDYLKWDDNVESNDLFWRKLKGMFLNYVRVDREVDVQDNLNSDTEEIDNA